MRRLSSSWIGLSALALASGCGVDADVFADEFPPAYCQRQIDCGGSGPQTGRQSTDYDACVEEWTVWLAEVEADDRCEYDRSSARQCLAALEDSACDENTAIYYECRDAWSESKAADDGDDEDECRFDSEDEDDESEGDTGAPPVP